LPIPIYVNTQVDKEIATTIDATYGLVVYVQMAKLID
jgi:hypothetical protein